LYVVKRFWQRISRNRDFPVNPESNKFKQSEKRFGYHKEKNIDQTFDKKDVPTKDRLILFVAFER
jgi:hypothetical protein